MEEVSSHQVIYFSADYFGCPTSQYEKDALRTLLQKEGFKEVQKDKADIYIINSCVVTGKAARNVRKAARRARKGNPGLLIVITGCYSQVYSREIFTHIPEVEIAVGNSNRAKIPDILRQRFGQRSMPPWNLVDDGLPDEPLKELSLHIDSSKVRPVLKIQEGCDEFCRYCIVARARGKPRSLEPQAVWEQAQGFLQKGYREIVLTGTHIGIYGREWEEWNLARLLKLLSELPYDFRLRLTAVEPMSINEELLQVMAENEKICPHLYMPIQSGSDRVLQLMGRRYTARDISTISRQAKEMMPDISLYTDIITGFPGEKEEDHYFTLSLLEELEFSGLHIFSYSPRPFTAAYHFREAIRPDIKKQRLNDLENLKEKLALRFHCQMEGKLLRILVEKCSEEWVEGYADNYTWSKFKETAQLQEGQGNLKGSFVWLKPRESHTWGVKGELH